MAELIVGGGVCRTKPSLREPEQNTTAIRAAKPGRETHNPLDPIQMEDLELLYFDPLERHTNPNSLSLTLNRQSITENGYFSKKSLSRERRCAGVGSACDDSEPWTAMHEGRKLGPANPGTPEQDNEAPQLWKHETEFSLNCKEGDDLAYLAKTSTQESPTSDTCSLCNSFSSEHEGDYSELYILNEDEDLTSEGSGKSVDYGFIIAVTCLVTGISLVAISYMVPRDVRVDHGSVSAREMERLEHENARVGAHLDRCVIAGLCLLTLGGVLLSTLLMVSMWKGEMIRRKAFAYSRHAATLYGSINLKACSSPTRDSSLLQSSCGDDFETLS